MFEQTNCSEADLDNGNDVNMFGEQLSQSIMLESSLGQVSTIEVCINYHVHPLLFIFGGLLF